MIAGAKNTGLITYSTGADDSPIITIDNEKKIIRVVGASYPEDAVDSFIPILDWLKEIDPKNSEKVTIEFDFTILSSASNKMVYEILLKLLQMNKEGLKVEVFWYYEAFDEDLEEEGRSFKAAIDLPFHIVIK
jgi:hypothetical protein